MLGRITGLDSQFATVRLTQGETCRFSLRMLADGPRPQVGSVVSVDGSHVRRRKSGGYPWDIKSARVISAADAAATLREIAEWKREAKLEDMSRYFYHTDEAAAVIAGKYCFVIGRKGSGKTALGDHLRNTTSHDHFAHKLSFKNFPFNDLYGLSNERYTAPNQYITLWKYLLYSTLAQLMVNNQAIESRVREQLESVYKRSLKRSLSANVREWTGGGLALTVLGTGGTAQAAGSIAANETSWVERVEVLEEFLLDNLDLAKYVVVWDELDEDYSHLQSPEEVNMYLTLLTGLFKAVQDVRAVFPSGAFNVRPVVLLRDDIFDRLTDSDRSKWEDLTVRLAWDDAKARRMLAFRISRAMNPTGSPMRFDDAWSLVCEPDPVARGGGFDSPLGYMGALTLKRPRDYVVCMRECAQSALDRRLPRINSAVVTAVKPKVSRYMRSEFEDELGGRLPEIAAIFEVLSSIGKQTFSVKEFSAQYEKAVQKNNLKPRSVATILAYLFEYSVIGYQTRDNNIVFRVDDSRAVFPEDRPIVVMRGLYESLHSV